MKRRERTGPYVTLCPLWFKVLDNGEQSLRLFQAGAGVVGGGRGQLPRSQETPDDLVGVDVLAGLSDLLFHLVLLAAGPGVAGAL